MVMMTTMMVSPSRAALWRTFSTAVSNKHPRVLITGSCGQIGVELARELRSRYGRENVVASDVRKPPPGLDNALGPFRYANVLDFNSLETLVVEHSIDLIIHNASLLSGAGEKNPKAAMDINIQGLHNVLELSRIHSLRVFAPSSIAAFGPDTPQIANHLQRVRSGLPPLDKSEEEGVPDLTIQRPNTIYGVSKVYIELLGSYYHKRFGVDFRSLRYPGIISASEPGGGTTDYAVYAYLEALGSKHYTCFLRPDTLLPMMYMPDCIRGTVDFLEAPNEKLTQRTYNLAAVSFTPDELLRSIQSRVPDFSMDYDLDFRQAIADTWPRIFDDSQARKDWGWKHTHDLDAMTDAMLEQLKTLAIGGGGTSTTTPS